MDLEVKEFAIRRLEPEADATIFRQIRLEALRTNPEAFGSEFAAESARPPDWFAEQLSASAVFGGFQGDDLVGMAGFSVERAPSRAHKGILWGVYVRPRARSAGIARSLVRTVLDHAAGKVETVNLVVERGNMNARRLYTSLGFAEYGLEKNALKVGDRYFDDVLMAKPLVYGRGSRLGLCRWIWQIGGAYDAGDRAGYREISWPSKHRRAKPGRTSSATSSAPTSPPAVTPASSPAFRRSRTATCISATPSRSA